eukprot:3941201-Rhodomonas_salina.11
MGSKLGSGWLKNRGLHRNGGLPTATVAQKVGLRRNGGLSTVTAAQKQGFAKKRGYVPTVMMAERTRTDLTAQKSISRTA